MLIQYISTNLIYINAHAPKRGNVMITRLRKNLVHGALWYIFPFQTFKNCCYRNYDLNIFSVRWFILVQYLVGANWKYFDTTLKNWIGKSESASKIYKTFFHQTINVKFYNKMCQVPSEIISKIDMILQCILNSYIYI